MRFYTLLLIASWNFFISNRDGEFKWIYGLWIYFVIFEELWVFLQELQDVGGLRFGFSENGHSSVKTYCDVKPGSRTFPQAAFLGNTEGRKSKKEWDREECVAQWVVTHRHKAAPPPLTITHQTARPMSKPSTQQRGRAHLSPALLQPYNQQPLNTDPGRVMTQYWA